MKLMPHICVSTVAIGALCVAFAPSVSFAAIAETTGGMERYLDDVAIALAGLGGLYLLDKLSWTLMTKR